VSQFRFPNHFPKFTTTLGFIEADVELGNKILLVPCHCLILLRCFVSIVNLYIYMYILLNKGALLPITENPRFPVIFTTGRIPPTYLPLPLEATKNRDNSRYRLQECTGIWTPVRDLTSRTLHIHMTAMCEMKHSG